MIIRIKDSRVHVRKSARAFYFIAVLIFIGLLAAGYFLIRQGQSSSPTSSSPALAKRLAANQLLFDFAGILKYEESSTETYLNSLRDHYQIEALIVTLPSLEGFGTIHDAALKLMSDWKVGQRFGNRGILLLLAKREKEVKMEVSYELEDVFTDSFTGYAEDLQLRPHLRQGTLGLGLVAVMEELEGRAHLKNQQNYTPKMIATLDAQFASGGAGANRKLRADSAASSFILSPGSNIFPDSALFDRGQAKNPRFPAGQTPAEAFQTMQAALRDRGDVRDAMYFDRIKGKSYQVVQNENRAIIYFGGNSEEENTPFFFAKTSSGWIFDLVNQARYVRYGPGHRWGIELGDSDYAPLLDKCSFSWWLDMDIPWEEEDIYRPENDTQIVSRILELQPQYQKNQNDFETALELGRLGVLIGRHPPQVVPCLQKAKKLRPQSPQPYRYMAIHYVISFEYKKAIAELEEMLKRDSESLFGRKLLGHLYYIVKDYDSAIAQLQEALRWAPRDCYVITNLSYAYVGRFQASGSPSDKTAALELFPQSETSCMHNYRRAWWLKNKLQDLGLMDKNEQPLLGASFYLHHYQDGKGVLLYAIQPGKPADLAGLQEGDFLMSFNDQPIFDHLQLYELIGRRKPGQKVKVEIIRGALEGPLTLGDVTVNPETYGLSQPQKMTITVTLGRKE